MKTPSELQNQNQTKNVIKVNFRYKFLILFLLKTYTIRLFRLPYSALTLQICMQFTLDEDHKNINTCNKHKIPEKKKNKKKHKIMSNYFYFCSSKKVLI